MGQFVSSISKTNIHPGQLSQRELLSSYLGNESPKTAFAFPQNPTNKLKANKEKCQNHSRKKLSKMKRTKHIMRHVVTYNELWAHKVRSLKVGHQMPH